MASQAETKLAYVNTLGAESVVALGNGRLMLDAAAVGTFNTIGGPDLTRRNAMHLKSLLGAE